MAPELGFHSVMLRPLSVSRVMPPTTTIASTIAAHSSSQRARRSGRAVAGSDIGRAYGRFATACQQSAIFERCNVVSFVLGRYILGHVARRDPHVPTGPNGHRPVRAVPGPLPGDGRI